MSNWSSGAESEYKQLLAQIANIERNMALPASREVSNALLTFLNSLKTRLGVLEEKQKAAEESKERAENLQRVVQLVERETALNAAEKEQYGSFLKQEYFTKADFGRLDEFYTNTYDKLTAEGKAQMSYRVWEGVRREEYRFSAMPESVKEREAAGVRQGLEAGHKNLKAIPEEDRSDFINAWDAGRKHESYKVLDRPSFAKSVSVSPAVSEKDAAHHEARNTTVVENEHKVKKPDAQAQSVQAKASRQNLNIEDAPEISLTQAEVKAPLSNLKKPVGPQGKNH